MVTGRPTFPAAPMDGDIRCTVESQGLARDLLRVFNARGSENIARTPRVWDSYLHNRVQAVVLGTSEPEAASRHILSDNDLFAELWVTDAGGDLQADTDFFSLVLGP